MSDIQTARVGDRLIVVNGVDPLAYVDLTKVNSGRKRRAIVRFKRVKPYKVNYFVRFLKGAK